MEVDGRRDDPPEFAAHSEHDTVGRAAFVDAWADRRLTVEVEPDGAMRRAPIETVSLSEGGAERLLQGVELRFRFALALAPGRAARVRFRLALTGARTAGARPTVAVRA